MVAWVNAERSKLASSKTRKPLATDNHPRIINNRTRSRRRAKKGAVSKSLFYVPTPVLHLLAARCKPRHGGAGAEEPRTSMSSMQAGQGVQPTRTCTRSEGKKKRKQRRSETITPPRRWPNDPWPPAPRMWGSRIVPWLREREGGTPERAPALSRMHLRDSAACWGFFSQPICPRATTGSQVGAVFSPDSLFSHHLHKKNNTAERHSSRCKQQHPLGHLAAPHGNNLSPSAS